MYYRPREKYRPPLVTFLLSMLLVGMTGILIFLLGIYVGYFQFEVTTVAERFQPTPTPTRSALLYVADGDAYFAEGKLIEAIAAYEKAIEIDPDQDVPYIRQSRLLVYTRDTAKALHRAAQAVLVNPNSPENLAYYCRALDWEAQYEEAEAACACAIELDPNYAEGYAFLSEVYADLGNWGAARATAQQAIDTNFQSMDAHHNMGYAYEVQGRYADAAKFYENAITLAPNLAPLYVDAARSYYWMGDVEKAEDRYKRAIRLNPRDPEAYERLGWTYYTNGEYGQAIDAMEQSVAVDPTHERGWGRLGLIYYARQNFETAIELLPKAIEMAEGKFLRRARQIEVYTQVETLVGPQTVPILRGRFLSSAGTPETYVADLQPVLYEAKALSDPDEFTCVTPILEGLQNRTTVPGLTETLEFTQSFSQTTGTATLNLVSGELVVDISQMPPPPQLPYEIKMRYWPNREDSIGHIQPDAQGRAQARVQFTEKLPAPIEYYYTLGLAFAYMQPPMCDRAVPWLLKSLEQDSGGLNPAWHGLRICPSSNSPPTPIPTFTPIPDSGQ